MLRKGAVDSRRDARGFLLEKRGEREEGQRPGTLHRPWARNSTKHRNVAHLVKICRGELLSDSEIGRKARGGELLRKTCKCALLQKGSSCRQLDVVVPPARRPRPFYVIVRSITFIIRCGDCFCPHQLIRPLTLSLHLIQTAADHATSPTGQKHIVPEVSPSLSGRRIASTPKSFHLFCRVAAVSPAGTARPSSSSWRQI